jgi:acyl-CoA dehydrogenase
MIDFSLSENDEKILQAVREEALICRKYARYYDDHEEEFAPDEL